LRHIAQDDRRSLVIDGEIHAVFAPNAVTARETPDLMLELNARFGARAAELTTGDFAAALWDGASKTLLLARDFTGTKPIHWTRLAGGAIAFASELKALLELPGFDATVDREMLQRLQHTKYLPSERTLFRAVHPVAPGATVAVTATGEVAEVARALMPPIDVQRKTPAEFERLIVDAFGDAIRARARTTARIGIALSGGIDSICVAAACRRALPDAVLHSFTAGNGDDDPEIQTAALVASRFKTVHHPVIVKPRVTLQHLPRAIWHMEAPIARSETLQLFEVGRAAGGIVDTLFTGSVADGLYAGMPNHKVLQLYKWLTPLRRALHEFHSLTQTGYQPRSMLGRLMTAMYFNGNLPPAPRVLGVDRPAALRSLPPLGPEFMNEFLHDNFLAHAAEVLPKLERPFAAFGVGLTSPFFDPRCIEVAFTIPSDLKLRGWKEKYILRRALRRLLADGLTHFPKFPMRMKYDAEFADCLDELVGRYLAPQRVKARGFFDPATLEPVRHYRRGGRYSGEGAMRAWTAVGTEIWAEQFLDRRGAPLADDWSPLTQLDSLSSAENIRTQPSFQRSL
jgi:asparagine synthase (glutamine-hydrolysing)